MSNGNSHEKIEKTVPPEIAARMEGHVLGARIRIPGIKVLRLIGEGGMGSVFLAEQSEPVQRQVALKLIKDNS